MRARMNPLDGQLYVVGMSAWATSQMMQTGGLYRIRYTGETIRMPVSLRMLEGAIELTLPLHCRKGPQPALTVMK